MKRLILAVALVVSLVAGTSYAGDCGSAVRLNVVNDCYVQQVVAYPVQAFVQHQNFVRVVQPEYVQVQQVQKVQRVVVRQRASFLDLLRDSLESRRSVQRVVVKQNVVRQKVVRQRVVVQQHH